MYRNHRNRPLLGKPIVIAGAGDAGVQMVQSLLSRPNGSYRPVALLDDNPFKSDLRIQGIRVEGPLAHLEEVARRHGAEAVLLAIPAGGSDLVRRMNSFAADCGIPLLV